MSMLRKLVMPVMAVAILAVFCGCGEKTTAEKAGDAVENGVKAVQDGAGDVAREGSKALDNLSENVRKYPFTFLQRRGGSGMEPFFFCFFNIFLFT